nr:hypothetical protein [Tanacetum cinerariifolium]
TLVDICYRSGISAGLDVCGDLTGSSRLTQTVLVDFVPGRAVIDAAQRKRGKYMDKCAAIRYEFLPFSFSSLGELESDVITLLKRIMKFSMTQDIGARAAVHIFNMIIFAIAKRILSPSTATTINHRRHHQASPPSSLQGPKDAAEMQHYTSQAKPYKS